MSSAKFEARLQFHDGTLRLDAGARVPGTTYRIGFWSAAILTALCVLQLGTQGVMFATMANNAIETNSAYYFAQAIAFLTAPLVVVLMACLYVTAAEGKKVFALSAVAFATIYATLGGINYYVQFTAVRLAMLNGQSDLIAPFFMPNLSVMFAFDILGYFFLTLSTLAAVPLFPGMGIERLLRWTLVINFLIGVAAVFGNFIANPMLLLPLLPITWIATGFGTALLAVWFRRVRYANVD